MFIVNQISSITDLKDWGLIIAVAIIGYFLRQLHVDLKNYIKELQNLKMEQNKLMDKVVLNELSSKKELEKIQEVTNLKLDNLNKSMEVTAAAMQSMSATMQDMTKGLGRLDANQKVISTYFERFNKMEDRVSELEKG